MTGTFVPTYQGLSAIDFMRPTAAPDAVCFPFGVTDRLPFYRARNAIYHLFTALREQNPTLTVLAPDYNSGNEILAMRAAGVGIHYCPVDRRMQLDPDVVERLCALHNPDVLYVIHYIGWPQPMPALIDLCRRRDMLLVEDCALSLLSEMDPSTSLGAGGPLGSFGDWSVFCLYKTLPLPNGALLVQNTIRLEALERMRLQQAGSASVMGRTAELLVQRIRGRANRLGAALQVVKRGMGLAAGALEVRRANVGDIGFNLDEVNLAMSGVSARLLDRLDFVDIKRRRVENYRHLDAQLDSSVARVFTELPDGVCPLFFPIIVPDKQAAARALQGRGIDALEFWNESMESGEEMGADARFLRQRVLELPIHQDLTPRQVEYVAEQVSKLSPVHVGAGFSRPTVRLKADPTSECVTTVECVTDPSAFAALRPEWNELLSASAANGPFLTWEWLHAWWTHLHGAATLKIIAIRDGNGLIAVAPLMATPGLRSWFSRLEFLGSGHAGSDYLDVIVRTGREADALRAIGRFLETQNTGLRLDHLPESSVGAQLAEQLASGGWAASTASGGVCPVISLAGHTWDSYLATLGSAHRANVRRRLRGAEQQFTMRFEQVTTDAGRRDALDVLNGFHTRRFHAEGGSTAFFTPALRAFQDDATGRALGRGWLRMYVLRLNDAPVAVMYGLFYNRQFYFYQHGFDDSYARHSVGLVLMALTIRAAIDEGAQMFDFLWGTEPYKWLWTRETRTLRQIQLFPPDTAGRIHRGAVEARRTLRRLVRRVAANGEHRAPSA